MFRCILRHRLLFTLVSNKQMIFCFNSPIHFQAKRWLWAGLRQRVPPLIRVCSFSSGVQELPSDENEKQGTKKARDGKSGSKQTKSQKKVCKKAVLAENELEMSKEKVRKRKSKKALQSETVVSDVNLDEGNQTVHSEDRLDGPPSLSFPFDGSSYTETDDEFNMYHSASVDLSCSADSSMVQRMDDFRSEGRFYHVSSAGASVLFPSVTTVLSNTPTKSQYYRLRNWKKSMIKTHGEEQFENIQQQTKDVGTHFHQELEKKLFKLLLPDSISIKPHLPDNEKTIVSPPHIHKMPYIGKEAIVHNIDSSGGSERSLLKAHDNPVSEYVKSVQHVLEQISCVLALESVVTHHELGYTGTFDCVVKYRDEVCLIDWKSSARPKPTLDDCYDFPLQAVAYAGAINHDDHYPFKVFCTLIVVAYADGAPAHAHFLSHKECQHYWNQWLHRLQEYQTQFASDHSNVY